MREQKNQSERYGSRGRRRDSKAWETPPTEAGGGHLESMNGIQAASLREKISPRWEPVSKWSLSSTAARNWSWPSSWVSLEVESCPEPPQRITLCQYLAVGLVRLQAMCLAKWCCAQTSDRHNHEMINGYCFTPFNLWYDSLLWQQ